MNIIWHSFKDGYSNVIIYKLRNGVGVVGYNDRTKFCARSQIIKPELRSSVNQLRHELNLIVLL